jgi:glyoxylase-like metal-dependent hydrolase (beta-lactamase superfamily II)
LVPAFRNAVFWSNEDHWKWATEPNDREKASFLKENILPIKDSGRLKMIDTKQNVSFTNNISIRFAFGHTDAMMLPLLTYKGKQIIFMADLLPSIGHIPVPYIMAYDTRPLESMSEKKVFLNDALANDYILFFEHDPVIECCTLQQTEKGIRHKDLFRLQDIV